jgi:hypothetical protein
MQQTRKSKIKNLSMSLPEISRRCRSCGAAVRAGARFCPQCGKPMEAEAGPTAGGTDAPVSAEMEARERAESNPLELDEPGAGDAREAESPREVIVARESEAPREWTPPTKEFSAFVQALEGVPARRDAAAPRGEGDAPLSLAASDAHRAVSDASPAASEASPAGSDARRAAGDASWAAGDAPRVESDVLRGGADVVHEDGDVVREGGVVQGVDGGAALNDAGDVAEADADERRGRVARVREGTRVRVGRMRDEALVALEETPDDSGLRFVVAAAALFLGFLLLLFLSTTILR